MTPDRVNQPRGRAPGSPGGPPGLDAQTRGLVRVAIAVATGDTAALKERLLGARAAQTPERWVDELLLQSLLTWGTRSDSRRSRCGAT